MMNLTEKIAKDLKLEYSYIEKIINRANYYYKRYSIPKKNGGTREIMQAGPELKSLQYWIKENILNKMPISDASYAYSKGNSIKCHALSHVKSKYILHSDIYHFFNSITSKMLEKQLLKHPDIFESLDLDMNDAITTISKICFRKNRLCIGTVSSPIISNIVMYDFDNELIDYCLSNDYIYSRYADDIYISSQDFISIEEKTHLTHLLAKYNFIINERKTFFASPKGRRNITGIIITDKAKISIGTEKKLQIKKKLYSKLVHGTGNTNEILGYLAFLKDIEPNYYNKLIAKYSTYCENDILEQIKRIKPM